jgi:putative redox protein
VSETPRPLEVSAVWRGGLAAEVEARGHRIAVDEPAAEGGGDTGVMPTELLAAALASCFTLAVAHVAGKRGIVLDDLRVDVRAERDGRALRYGRFVVTASSSLPLEELQPIVERAERFCWVSNTLAAPPAVEVRAHHLSATTEVQ